MPETTQQSLATVAGGLAGHGPNAPASSRSDAGVASEADARADRTERVVNGIRAYERTVSIAESALVLLWLGSVAIAFGVGLVQQDFVTGLGYALGAGFFGAIALGLAIGAVKIAISPWALALRMKARRLIDGLLPHPGLCRRWTWDAPWPNALALAVPERRLLFAGHLSHFEVVSIRADRIVDAEVVTKTEREIVTKHSGSTFIMPSRYFGFSLGSTSRTREVQRDFAWLDIRYMAPTSFEPVRLTVPFGEDVSAAGDFRAAIQVMRAG